MAETILNPAEVTGSHLDWFKHRPAQAHDTMDTISALIQRHRDAGLTHLQACELVFLEAWYWQNNA